MCVPRVREHATTGGPQERSSGIAAAPAACLPLPAFPNLLSSPPLFPPPVNLPSAIVNPSSPPPPTTGSPAVPLHSLHLAVAHLYKHPDSTLPPHRRPRPAELEYGKQNVRSLPRLSIHDSCLLVSTDDFCGAGRRGSFFKKKSALIFFGYYEALVPV